MATSNRIRSTKCILLDDTIKENIIFGRKIDDDTKIILNNAIKLAQLENLISNLPDGLDTLLEIEGQDYLVDKYNV